MPENQGDIDYVKVAEGFNCVAERVFSPDELAAAFERAKKSDRPYVIDVVCEPQAHCSMGNDISTIIEWNTDNLIKIANYLFIKKEEMVMYRKLNFSPASYPCPEGNMSAAGMPFGIIVLTISIMMRSSASLDQFKTFLVFTT